MLLGVPRLRVNLALVLLLIGLCASACGGDDVATSGPRFLIASAEGLTERTSAGDRVIFSFNDDSYVFDPSVSPDGKRIAFIRQPAATVDNAGNVDFGSDLYIVGMDGRGVRQVLRHSRVGEFLRNPAWLDHNRLMLNVRGRMPSGLPDLRIESIDLSSGARTRHVANAVELGLAPDKQSFAYANVDPDSQHELLTLYDIASGQSRLVMAADSLLVFLGSIAFSPDGNTIAFTAADPSTGVAPGAPSRPAHPTLQDVWLVNRDGSNQRRLAELAESQPSLAWAEDGRAIYALGAGGFWRIDATTGASEQMYPGVSFGQIALLPP